jgi:hypothetical protein
MAEDKKRSIQIEYASPTSDNDETRLFQALGQHVIHKNHQGGYFTDCYRASKDIDLSGVMAGRGKGFASLQIEDSSDEAAREQVQEIRQARLEVIMTYREWQQFDGMWTNTKAVVAWGYIANASLGEGPGSLGLEVHVIRHEVVNDALGTRDYTIDCITGSSTIKGGAPTRNPDIIPPYGPADGGNWDAPL